MVYHLHSDRSISDSCTSFEDYIDKAEQLRQTAIAFTEHGNIYNWIEKKLYCENHGLKYIHGIECYLTESLEEKVRDNYHTILLAKNYEGVKEINMLVDISTTPPHTYYKPRITFEEFLSISPNVICISACLASPLARLSPDTEIFDKLCRRYDYFEVQPHVRSESQKQYNKRLISLSRLYNKPLIAGTDTHSLNQYKAECRKMRMLAKDMKFAEEDEFDLTYKSREELEQMFRGQGVLTEDQIQAALDNTVVMANSVEAFELDTSFKYPKLYDDEEQVLRETLKQKYREKVKQGIIQKDPAYSENVREELRVFKKIGMIGFMLFMSKLITWCWENNIPTSFCRGSVGGSTIAYLLDIIDLNPVKWHTIFSRFANEDRKEIGDIDIDLPPTKRALVYDHIIQEFGEDYTAYILSLGTVSDKGVIDEIGRGLNTQWTRHSTEPSPYSLQAIDAIKSEYESDPEGAKAAHPDVFYYFDGMLDTVVSQSMHPAGIIVSPVSLPDNYGTFHADGKRILSINMEEVHEVSLVKYDLLGLKNVEIISDTCSFAHIPYPKSHTLNWEDADVWQDMLTSKVGLFQFESQFAFDYLKRYKPTRINDLSLLSAALRPSGESYRDRLIAGEVNKNPSALIDDMLKANNGFLVFQEDIIRFLQEICGLSGSEADNIRRAIGRKQKDRLDAALPQILEGYCSKSDKPRAVAEQEARAFLQIIEDSASYSFGYNHSTGYSMVTYACAYLRYYYPAQFIAAYLNNAKGQEDINSGTELAKTKGVEIRPIQFPFSGAKYLPDAQENVIYKGLASIKYIGNDLADALYEIGQNAPHTFLDMMKVSPCDSRQMRILITLNFFRMYGKRGNLMKQLELFESYYARKSGVWTPRKMFRKDAIPETWREFFFLHSDETEKQVQVWDMDGLFEDIASTFPDDDLPVADIIAAQSEYLGYIEDVFPEMAGCYYVEDVNAKYSPRFRLYGLADGETVTAKASRRDYQFCPVSKGNIIYVHGFQQKQKRIKDGEEWRVVPGEFETWMNGYSLREHMAD